MIPQQYLQKLEVEKTIFDHSEKIKLIIKVYFEASFIQLLNLGSKLK